MISTPATSPRVWLTTQKEVTPATGAYWYHRRAQSPHPATRGEDFQDGFVTAEESRTGVALT